MTTIEYNLSGLTQIYNAAYETNPTLCFEIANGRGRFVFMMFFSKEDEKSKDRLFILLKRTRVLLEVLLYGSHPKGVFTMYIKPADQQRIIEELDITHGHGNQFNFTNFLDEVNNCIPTELPLAATVSKLKENKQEIVALGLNKRIIDDSTKIYPIGPWPLCSTEHKPDEKKLCKLYLYINADPSAIINSIQLLKNTHHTFAWSVNPTQDFDLVEAINKINARRT